MLLEDKELNGIPLLVLGNKIDLKPHLTESEIITGKILYFSSILSIMVGLNLDYVVSNQWIVMMVSALAGTHISEVIDWLVKKSK